MLSRSAIWIESTKTKVSFAIGEKNSLIMPRLFLSSKKHKQCTADLHSAKKTDM